MDNLAHPGGSSELPLIKDHLRTLDPAKLLDRNRTITGETNQISRLELDKLRVLIGRIATISRKGFAAAPAQEALERRGAADRPARKTADGIEIETIPAAGLQTMLLGALRKAGVTVREIKSKVEVAKKRPLKSDLLHAMNVLYDKIKKAAEGCDKVDSDAADTALAKAAAETMVPLLREIMAAQTNFSARMTNAKLTPVEKQPLTTLLYSMKAKLSDDLKDVESLRSELAARLRESESGPGGAADHAAAGPPARTGAAGEQDTAAKDAAARKIAAIASAANGALRPVKDKMAGLNTKILDQQRETQELIATTRALQDEISEARGLMTRNFALIEKIAADFTMTNDEYVDKFDRWQRQLVAVDTEAENLLKAVQRIAVIELAMKTAAALEHGIATREHRAQALETISRSLSQVRETREACAAAARAEWRTLKAAASYLESSDSDLAAYEAALKGRLSRIEKLHTIYF